MNWKTKAKIQRCFALFPDTLSYALYHQVQKYFGNARCVQNPLLTLTGGVTTLKKISKAGYPIVGKIFFELGTGWTPMAPLAYWLAGAEKTVTVDLNRYFKRYLLKANLAYIYEHQVQVAELFGSLLNKDRFETLLKFYKSLNFNKMGGGIKEMFALCHIDYHAPCDAAKIKLMDKSIDYYTSFDVLEHIPPDVLVNILRQGNRIVKDSGLFVHCIDYCDHFAYNDKTISIINFFQYSDREWSKYTSRYSYTNRLRHDDFLSLIEQVGHAPVSVEVEDVHAERIRELIVSGSLPINARFQSKEKEVLTITGSWIITKKI